MDWLSALAILFVGLLAGILISRWIFAEKDRAQNLSKQLDEIHAEYAVYQEKVDQHFRKTADLVNDLTKTYSAIHQHLAMGAQTLSKRTLAQTEIQQNFLSPSDKSQTNDFLEPPRDYAPKENNDKGTLAEDFGLGPKEENEKPK